MAGDWIKVEHALPDKPEVIQLADRLSIDQDAVAGKLLRFWIWADQQTIDGNAPGATSAFIDRLTNCPGFSAALRDVGWLSDRQGRLQLPNFERHNGQSAKKRALGKDRSKRSRDATSVTEPLPEKRREENKETTPAVGEVGADFFPKALKFLEDWNATDGARKCSLIPSQIGCYQNLGQRINEPNWFENYPRALAKFPLRGLPDGMSVSRFLEPEMMWKVLSNEWNFTPKGETRARGKAGSFDFDAALKGSAQ